MNTVSPFSVLGEVGIPSWGNYCTENRFVPTALRESRQSAQKAYDEYINCLDSGQSASLA